MLQDLQKRPSEGSRLSVRLRTVCHQVNGVRQRSDLVVFYLSPDQTDLVTGHARVEHQILRSVHRPKSALLSVRQTSRRIRKSGPF